MKENKAPRRTLTERFNDLNEETDSYLTRQNEMKALQREKELSRSRKTTDDIYIAIRKNTALLQEIEYKMDAIESYIAETQKIYSEMRTQSTLIPRETPILAAIIEDNKKKNLT